MMHSPDNIAVFYPGFCEGNVAQTQPNVYIRYLPAAFAVMAILVFFCAFFLPMLSANNPVVSAYLGKYTYFLESRGGSASCAYYDMNRVKPVPLEDVSREWPLDAYCPFTNILGAHNAMALGLAGLIVSTILALLSALLWHLYFDARVFRSRTEGVRLGNTGAGFLWLAVLFQALVLAAALYGNSPAIVSAQLLTPYHSAARGSMESAFTGSKMVIGGGFGVTIVFTMITIAAACGAS